MKPIRFLAVAAAALMLAAPAVSAQENPTVGGAPMSAQMNIIQNALNSPIHTTLVAAVQAAGLVDTLQGPGPFTVFAPVDTAFEALPAGTVETLLEPANLSELQRILTSHVVAGNLSAAEIMERAGDTGFRVETVSGANLDIFFQNGQVYVRDENGGVARVTIADVNQSNGVIHVVDKVLLPE